MIRFFTEILALLERAPRCRHPRGTCGELSWTQVEVAEWDGRVNRQVGPFGLHVTVMPKRTGERHPALRVKATAFGRTVMRRAIEADA